MQKDEEYIAYYKMIDDSKRNCEDFIFAYLEVIRKQLLQGLVSPNDLLLNSGALTLAIFADLKPVKFFIRQILNNNLLFRDSYSNLSIIYYTFLNEIIAVDIEGEVRKYLSNNKDILNFIEKTRIKYR